MRKKAGAFIMSALLVATSLTVNAMDNGAYLASVQTSYANPDTGETVDGGTNIALGDSMCESIVDDQVLIEKTDNKMYVTVGLGLMSNVSEVSMQVVNDKGEFRDVELTLTGNCERDNDTCNHYRFEMEPDDKYFSPIMFVTPMGRDVQFFVSIDYNSIQEGTGNFQSEMLEKKAETKNDKVKEKSSDTSQKKEQVNKQNDKDNTSSNKVWIATGGVLVIIAGATLIIMKKRRK